MPTAWWENLHPRERKDGGGFTLRWIGSMPNHHTTRGWRLAKRRDRCKALLGARIQLTDPGASADKKIYISPQGAAERTSSWQQTHYTKIGKVMDQGDGTRASCHTTRWPSTTT